MNLIPSVGNGRIPLFWMIFTFNLVGSLAPKGNWRSSPVIVQCVIPELFRTWKPFISIFTRAHASCWVLCAWRKHDPAVGCLTPQNVLPQTPKYSIIWYEHNVSIHIVLHIWYSKHITDLKTYCRYIVRCFI